jgi:O-antigen/teichoic acid export membrane protein
MTRPILLMAAARGISLLFGIVLLGVLGRRLGPAGFGTLQFAVAVMVYPTILVDLGLTTYGLRELANGGASSAIIGRVLGARAVLALGVMVAILVAVVVLPLDTEMRTILVILAIGVPVSALNVRWVLQGERRFDRAAVIEILTTASQLIAALLLVQNTSDVVPAASALTLGIALTTASSIVSAGGWSRFRPQIGGAVRGTVARSLPLGAAAIAIAIYYSIDTVLLGFLRSGQEVAFYTAAYRLILPVLGLASVVATVAIPHLSFLSVSDEAAADLAAVTLSRHIILVALPIAIGGALVVDPIIVTVYGPAFLPASGPFRILVFSVATVYANAAFAFLLLARHQDLRYLSAVTAGAVVNVAANLLVIPIAGMMGAAVTTIGSEILVLGLILWWTRDVSLRAVREATRVAALPTAAMALAVWPLKASIFAVPIGMAVFGLVAIATGAVSVRQLFDQGIRRWGDR